MKHNDEINAEPNHTAQSKPLIKHHDKVDFTEHDNHFDEMTGIMDMTQNDRKTPQLTRANRLKWQLTCAMESLAIFRTGQRC